MSVKPKKPRDRKCIALPLLIVLTALMANAACGQATTQAYTADINGIYGAYSAVGLNLGHGFVLYNTNIQVFSLGVYDFGGDGLVTAHAVTIFSDINGAYSPVAGASVTVPAGTNAPLTGGYRFQPLLAPVVLVPGNYAIVAYQMNGYTASDPYEDDDGFNG